MGACFGVPVLAGRLAPLRFAAARCQDGHAYAPTRLATLGASSVWCSGLGTSLRHSLTYGHQTSAPRITRSCRYSVTPVVRGLPPTPSQAQKKSFARYRSLIRGLPPTPAEAHQESLVRAATASLTSFVGSRPHPHKCRRSHSLAPARSFVGSRPHPHKPTKNHSFVPL